MDLDIVIPTYNAKNTLYKTLASIAIQREIEGIHVYLVNDCSDYDYSDFTNYFSKFFSIEEIKSLVNVGPGESRNIGIKKGNGKYIVFIDSDDYFYSPFALKEMYSMIDKEKSDLVISNFIYERDNEVTIKKENPVWLHGKIYRREFLEKNNILFNTTRANEDNGFNRLILLLKPKIQYLNKITYVYSENKDSITRKNNRLYKFEGLEGFTYNMNWAMKEAMKRGCNKQSIGIFSQSVLVTMYYYYLDYHKDYDGEKIIKWCVDTKKLYDSYGTFLTDKETEKNLKIKENEYRNEGKYFYNELSFYDFLEKVGEYYD